MENAHTLTALFRDAASAGRAAERLRAAGVTDCRIELHPADSGDVRPGEHVVEGGLLGSLTSLLTPEAGQPPAAGPAGPIGRTATVLIATSVPADRLGDARRALEDEAVEVDAVSDR